VQRLAGSDAGFLFIETPRQTSVCVDWAELTPPAADAPPLTIHDVRRHVAARLPLLPSWRWRLEEVPLGLHHPVWVEDPDFDLDNHLREATLPAPGGPAEIEAFLAAVLPELLDLRHPLWEMTLVSGLEGDRQALLFRFHHTLADGAALLTTLDRLFGPAPAPGDADAQAATDPTRAPASAADPTALDDPEPPAAPKRRALLGQALREQGRNWAEAPKRVRTTLERFKAVDARKAEDGVAFVPKSMGDAPATILNRGAPSGRHYARTLLPIAELQRVRKAVRTPERDVTLNDVVLAVVSGALRTYLAERDELPDKPLVVNVPVGGDPPGTPPRQWGNRFSNFFSNLATDVADPVERLRTIAASTEEAKVQLDLQGRDTLPGWLDRIPPAIARPGARILDKRFEKDPAQVDFSVLVSNVRVPEAPWDLGGHGVDHLFMSGPIADNAGLNVTVVGFRDHLHLSIVASPAAIDRPHELIDDLHAALEELVACTA
jgi:diacylglycerol O-acyltransferase